MDSLYRPPPLSYLPLTEAAYCVLLCLTNPLHGYAIMEKVTLMTGSRLMLSPGTLYGLLRTFEHRGLIYRDMSAGRYTRRKLYVLTDLGREVLEAELDRLEQLTRSGREIIAPAVSGDIEGKPPRRRKKRC